MREVYRSPASDMTIHERTIGAQTILDIHGNVLSSDTSAMLTDRVNALLADGHKEIVLNLAAVSYVDSSGLSAMVTLYKTAKKDGGEIRLMFPMPWSRRIFNRRQHV